MSSTDGHIVPIDLFSILIEPNDRTRIVWGPRLGLLRQRDIHHRPLGCRRARSIRRHSQLGYRRTRSVPRSVADRRRTRPFRPSSAGRRRSRPIHPTTTTRRRTRLIHLPNVHRHRTTALRRPSPTRRRSRAPGVRSQSHVGRTTSNRARLFGLHRPSVIAVHLVLE